MISKRLSSINKIDEKIYYIDTFCVFCNTNKNSLRFYYILDHVKEFLSFL